MLKYVSKKDKKAFANDLKNIYHAPNEETSYERMHEVTKKWHDKYPNSMKRWDVISTMFKFSADVRKVMYTTNAIESLNNALRRLTPAIPRQPRILCKPHLGFTQTFYKIISKSVSL